jgi:hypothetical protein
MICEPLSTVNCGTFRSCFCIVGHAEVSGLFSPLLLFAGCGGGAIQDECFRAMGAGR